MSTQSILVGVVLVILLAGGAVFFGMSGSTQVQNSAETPTEVLQPGVGTVEQGDAKMPKNEGESDGAMMEKKDSAMSGEDGSMMKKDDSMMMGDAMMEKGSGAEMSHSGSYEAYSPEKIARAGTGDVVLFFRASWCPTCKAVDADIRNNLSAIPGGVTILDVNYDTETALKQKYGVTYQHTFVQVDASGKQIAKWSASPTLAALIQNIQ
jgi:thiol-disulfide isomerase/thioredoxin